MFVLKKTVIVLALLQVGGIAHAANQTVPDQPHVKQQAPDLRQDRKTSRQKIIDAAQIYCSGGTPFDRVHAYLQDFWAEKDAAASPPKITCRLP